MFNKLIVLLSGVLLISCGGDDSSNAEDDKYQRLKSRMFISATLPDENVDLSILLNTESLKELIDNGVIYTGEITIHGDDSYGYDYEYYENGDLKSIFAAFGNGNETKSYDISYIDGYLSSVFKTEEFVNVWGQTEQLSEAKELWQDGALIRQENLTDIHNSYEDIYDYSFIPSDFRYEYSDDKLTQNIYMVINEDEAKAKSNVYSESGKITRSEFFESNRGPINQYTGPWDGEITLDYWVEFYYRADNQLEYEARFYADGQLRNSTDYNYDSHDRLISTEYQYFGNADGEPSLSKQYLIYNQDLNATIFYYFSSNDGETYLTGSIYFYEDADSCGEYFYLKNENQRVPTCKQASDAPSTTALQ